MAVERQVINQDFFVPVPPGSGLHSVSFFELDFKLIKSRMAPGEMIVMDAAYPLFTLLQCYGGVCPFGETIGEFIALQA